jgi:co-chaperonin GroES (HSP10)
MTNMVLIEVQPAANTTFGGVYLPENIREGSKDEKRPVVKAIVVAIGPWRKTRQGFSVLPDFAVGHTVLCSPYRGVKMTRNIGERYQLVRTDDVLAVIDS